MKGFTIGIRMAVVGWLGTLLIARASLADDWPAWRGPTGQGHTSEKDLPLVWNAKTGKNVLWKATLHVGARNNPDMTSPGWSCPIVWRERVFLATAIWKPEIKDQKERRKIIAEHHVLCFRTEDGKPLWDTVVPQGKCLVDNVYHGYAVPTPVTDGKHVFALFDSGVLTALDFDGKIIWREELPLKREVDGGICASLVLHDDSVILSGIANPVLRAHYKQTGKLKWEQKGREHNRMATPALLRIAGRLQLIHMAAGVQGLDPDTGELLWSCRAPSGLSSPVYGEGLIYTDSGRGGRTGAAVDPTGKGNVSKTHVKWQIDVTAPAGSSGIVVGPYLYRACNNDILRCWKMATGELVYEKRLPRISPSTSPIATADGRIYFASSGRSYVIEAGPECKILATNDLDERDPFVTPAVSGERIFIKGKSYLWCIGNGAKDEESIDHKLLEKREEQKSTGLKPLTEMTADDRYKGEDGGLYGGGKNEPPKTHQLAAQEALKKITPLDAKGKPSKEGKIVFIALGMSNTYGEFRLFKEIADRDPQKSPHVLLVNCAVGGAGVSSWARPRTGTWQKVAERLKEAGVTPTQVQVAWIKHAEPGPSPDATVLQYARKIKADIAASLAITRSTFPNLRVAYLSSRIYGGYNIVGIRRVNPEPFAYETAFSVRWVIQDQIQLTKKGKVDGPILLWGLYLWADGIKPRKSDKLVWQRKDFGQDGVHPSKIGGEKVARMLLEFFKNDPGARSWFVKK
jgi:outer membrane protein assembly factor BamB